MSHLHSDDCKHSIKHVCELDKSNSMQSTIANETTLYDAEFSILDAGYAELNRQFKGSITANVSFSFSNLTLSFAEGYDRSKDMLNVKQMLLAAIESSNEFKAAAQLVDCDIKKQWLMRLLKEAGIKAEIIKVSIEPNDYDATIRATKHELLRTNALLTYGLDQLPKLTDAALQKCWNEYFDEPVDAHEAKEAS